MFCLNINKSVNVFFFVFSGLLEGRIQGWVEGAALTPFSLKLSIIFIEFSEKQKVST